ncbi:FAD-dependent oxidoreductase, partial [Acinetobacter baumannii]
QTLNFVVIGGGPTGVEMAGAIAELTRHSAGLDFTHISPECIRVILIEAGERVLASFPPDLSAHAERALTELGVELRLGARVTDIRDGTVMI